MLIWVQRYNIFLYKGRKVVRYFLYRGNFSQKTFLYKGNFLQTPPSDLSEPVSCHTSETKFPRCSIFLSICSLFLERSWRLKAKILNGRWFLNELSPISLHFIRKSA